MLSVIYTISIYCCLVCLLSLPYAVCYIYYLYLMLSVIYTISIYCCLVCLLSLPYDVWYVYYLYLMMSGMFTISTNMSTFLLNCYKYFFNLTIDPTNYIM